MDIDENKVLIAKSRIGDNVNFSVGNIYNIQQPEGFFDLVIAAEVLEHLNNPLAALKEMVKISKRYIIISTPNEPIWRIANIMRLKHLKDFGNTPGHINHWSKNALCKFANQACDVKIIRTPFPWTILLCEKRWLSYILLSTNRRFKS